MASIVYSDVHIHAQERATRALLKFCDDHNYKNQDMANIRKCLDALDTGNIEDAVNNYKKVPLGGNGCFNDWLPPVTFEHETKEYVSSVFEALVAQWSILMRLSIPKE